MRMPSFLKRPPDLKVGGQENPYMLRWHIIPRNPIFNIYLHKFLRDDDDRALHDHPWPSVSYIIEGGYIEHLDKGRKRLWYKGAVIFRRASHRHRIELLRDLTLPRPFGKSDYPVKPAWTIFITGFRIREWGFWCPSSTGFKFVHWKKFTAAGDRGDIGKGCNQ